MADRGCLQKNHLVDVKVTNDYFIIDTPDWRKPNVRFGWVKFDKKGEYQPAFIFPPKKGTQKPMAQSITLKGMLSSKKKPFEASATPKQLKEAKKPALYLKALKKFNVLNNCQFN